MPTLTIMWKRIGYTIVLGEKHNKEALNKHVKRQGCPLAITLMRIYQKKKITLMRAFEWLSI